MKKLAGIFAALIIVSMGTACTRVDPGHVGIKVNLVGSSRGVDDLHIVTGRVFYNPWTTQVVEFPTFVQRIAWTKDPHEGSPNDESFTFNSIEGSPVNVDVAAAVQFNGDLVPDLYVEFRKEAERLVDGYVRDRIRNAFNRVGSTMEVSDIYGAGKSRLIDEVQKMVVGGLEPRGIILTDLSFIGQPRLPANVEQSISQVIEAQNQALRANEKVAQAKAEAEQVAAKAHGEAQRILLEAEAKAKANRIIAQSITPQLIQFEALTKWNGTLPKVTGGAVPFINIPTSK